MRRARWPQLRAPGRRRRHPLLRETQERQRRYRVGPVPPRGPRRRRPAVPWLRLALAALALALAGSAAWGAWWLLDGPMLRVQSVRVTGAEAVSAGAVARAADLGGRSQFSFDSDEAAGRVVAALPAVKAASVRREWPQGVVVAVTEHAGWAWWQSGGRRVAIDADGVVIPAGRPPAPDAVTIHEVGAVRPLEPWSATDRGAAATVAQIVTDARSQRLGLVPERFEFHPDRGLVVRVADGPDVVFGDWRNYAFKVAAWGALLNRIERERLEVSEIDLRFGRQLVMR